ncbi:hypothetical protein BH09SUM1_BH09SUM1_22650 [soil metagenome]
MTPMRFLPAISLAGMLLSVAPITAQKTAEELNEAQPKGALTGASIFVSPGHGWHNSSGAGWVTQRTETNGVVEDISNGEDVLEYLVPYLWNAGARVYTTRERDMNPHSVTMEAGADGCSLKGEWQKLSAEGAHGGDMMQSSSAGATATFTPNIPEAGFYAAYVWYRDAEGADTARIARFTVNHAGGSTTWTQDETHDGLTWKYIGTYWFEAGANAAKGSLTISGDGGTIVADAVRFGGGMGDAVDHGSISGKPRWEESGLYYSQFLGYDPTHDTRKFNTVSAMPMWAEWEAEDWERGKSVYIAWHSNASGGIGSGRGFFSFVYGPNAWGPLTDFTGYPGGVELVNTIHDEVMNDINAGYDKTWRNGAKVCRWLGETNPRNNNKMPAALFEFGFHDNPEDAKMILDPKFRNIAARAVYHGLVKYYSENMQGFANKTLLPEPPSNLRITSDAAGHARIAWEPPPANKGDGLLGDGATGYRVYRSLHGKAFDSGVRTTTTHLDVTELDANRTTFFRVAAVNDGGESMPGETLAVRAAAAQKPRVLIVNGFDRMDGGLNVVEGKTQRGIVQKMNSRDYSIQHGRALEAAGYNFDSASNEAVTSDSVHLRDYAAVVWMLGQENGAGEVFSPREIELLTDYLKNHGALFLSGSDIASSLTSKKQGSAFLHDKFNATSVLDDSGSHTVTPTSDSIFAGIAAFHLDDGTAAAYRVQTPDSLAAKASARAAFNYETTPNAGIDAAVAGITFEGDSRLVFLGFPFETINEPEARNPIMAKSMEFLLRGK